MTYRKAFAVASMLVLCAFTGTASAQIFTGFYDFADTQYADDFTDVRRGPHINGGGLDLGRTGHTALNFTGGAGPAGDTWVTKWTPGGTPVAFNGRCGTALLANILIHSFNNQKGVGLVALLNDEVPGDKGLALVVFDNGNTDTLQLATVDPLTGTLTPLRTFPLFGRVRENAWYVLFMDVTVELAFEGHDLTVDALLLGLQDPTDPTSDFAELVGGMRFQTRLEWTGLRPEGQVGMVASARSAAVDSSVTNWAAGEHTDPDGPCSSE